MALLRFVTGVMIVLLCFALIIVASHIIVFLLADGQWVASAFFAFVTLLCVSIAVGVMLE